VEEYIYGLSSDVLPKERNLKERLLKKMFCRTHKRHDTGKHCDDI